MDANTNLKKIGVNVLILDKPYIRKGEIIKGKDKY
jgi:hypothetical protein